MALISISGNFGMEDFGIAFWNCVATGSGLEQTGQDTGGISVAAHPSAGRELEADVDQKELQTLPSH